MTNPLRGLWPWFRGWLLGWGIVAAIVLGWLLWGCSARPCLTLDEMGHTVGCSELIEEE